ncbi:hypothetical protein Tsubulata_010495 [Turnera subulata]|uniref:Uncharacterized protein n=1 Tax=Turnera subulata TaxID=218843 RepID=A0A9Q0J578_9ROSI|nr:hypothetical protein Tsubulata_010495 [Turnera subulata]
MEEYMRKLALWHTRTFTPLMAHDDLEPIMLSMGFEGQSPCNGWKEYAYVATHIVPAEQSQSQSPPRPRLPYPSIDGCHQLTFQSFIDAVSFYLRAYDVADVFHIRAMPLHRVHDRNRKWRKMQDDETVYVFRDGTIDPAAANYHLDNPGNDGCDSAIIRDKANKNPINLTVPLKDIITG